MYRPPVIEVKTNGISHVLEEVLDYNRVQLESQEMGRDGGRSYYLETHYSPT